MCAGRIALVLRRVLVAHFKVLDRLMVGPPRGIAPHLGDGVMVYFGYPEAHDNDAERASRAGLAILEVISSLN